MRKSDHDCTMYCVVYSYQEVCPMTCNPLHSWMLMDIATKRSYPRAQIERKPPEKKGSKTTTSTKQPRTSHG